MNHRQSFSSATKPSLTIIVLFSIFEFNFSKIMLIFYITFPDTTTASQICNQLIDQKLIACYNLIPIQSAYLWEGSLCADNEVATLLKTSKHLEQTVEQAVLAIHPYTTPCIIRWEVQANEAYENWVTVSVRP